MPRRAARSSSRSSATDLGQGLQTVIGQIAAETIGVPFEKSSSTPPTPTPARTDMGTFASRAHPPGRQRRDHGGDRGARVDARGRRRGARGGREDLETDGTGFIKLTGPGRDEVRIADIALAAHFKHGRTIAGRGIFLKERARSRDRRDGPGLDPGARLHGRRGRGRRRDRRGEVPASTTSTRSAAQVNPALAQGQIEGGAWMGMSHALFETTEPYYPRRDHGPRDFSEYLMPGPLEMPVIESVVLEMPGERPVRGQGHRRDDRQLADPGDRQRHLPTRAASGSTSCPSPRRRCCAAWTPGGPAPADDDPITEPDGPDHDLGRVPNRRVRARCLPPGGVRREDDVDPDRLPRRGRHPRAQPRGRAADARRAGPAVGEGRRRGSRRSARVRCSSSPPTASTPSASSPTRTSFLRVLRPDPARVPRSGSKGPDPSLAHDPRRQRAAGRRVPGAARRRLDPGPARRGRARPPRILDNRSNAHDWTRRSPGVSGGRLGAEDRHPARRTMGQLDIFSLEGRVALVAGGGGAIGAALAEALAGAGARVAVAGRTAESSRPPSSGSGRPARRGSRSPADATSEADCERMVEETVTRFGRVDIVVNAVGGGAGKVAPPGGGVSARRLGLDHGAQRPQHDRADAGGGPRR